MRLLLLLAGLSGVLGCLSEADRRQWDEAMRDARGENMRMGNGQHVLDRISGEGTK